MSDFFERMHDKYGILAVVCCAITFIMLAIIVAFISIITYGLFLLLFPLGLAYMAYKTYYDGDKE